MSYENKQYYGEIYSVEQHSFRRHQDPLGKGGNGTVYDICILEEPEKEAVAKFFRCGDADPKKKAKRYERFRQEVEFLRKEGEMDGVVPMLFAHCPENLPNSDYDAWYVMPKAKGYKLRDNANTIKKIDEMLRLADIIKRLHEKGVVHRDIKPENILILNKKLCLTDFGLLWDSNNTERLTTQIESIGPHKIMPPELEAVDPRVDTDFKASDVYLFAKVLWMRLKGDNQGFRGQYNRGEQQIYLRKEDFSALTMEPLHQLIEKATEDDPDDRIGLEECINLLHLQRDIISAPDINADLIRQLQMKEALRENVAGIEPDVLVYTEAGRIADFLAGVVPLAFITIETTGKQQRELPKLKFEVRGDRIFEMFFLFNGRRVNYRFEPEKLEYRRSDEMTTVYLRNMDQLPDNWVSFGKSLRSWSSINVYLEKSEVILIGSKTRLNEVEEPATFE